MAAVEFRILGPLEVVAESRVIEVPRTMVRRLLAALVIRLNQAVPAEELVEILWGTDPPRTSANGLQAYVSQLRKVLGRSSIETRALGYALVAEPAVVDARRFEELVAQGRGALAGRDPGTAARLLQTGLGLWRGPALSEFVYDSFAQPEATRLEELRIVATEALVDAELAMGGHAALVSRLRALVQAHPLRERLWAQLMTALYRSGRQAEALRAYAELRRLLGEELGIEPTRDLQQLESDMLLQSPALDWSPPAATGAPVPRTDPATAAGVPETRYAKSGPLHIAYQVTGEGDLDILVVPGWISHLESQWEDPSYRRFMERLGSYGRVIRFDKRNMGLSDRTGDAMPALEDRMDDLRAVMDAASSEEAVVIGVSEGSALSIMFAATCPERVAGLVLVGGSARLATGPDYAWGMTEQAAEALRQELDRRWGTGVTLPLIHPSAAGDPSALAWWSRFERMAASPGAAIATAAMCLQIDVRPLLPALRIPALVLHRRDDLLVDAAHGRYLAEHIRDARYAELPGNDHWPWVGDAGSVLDEIEAFVSGAARRRVDEPDAVLATVVVLEADGAVDDVRDLVRQALSDARGREAPTDGRRLVVTFDGPARGIRWALAACDELNHRGLAARAGVHIGEVPRRDSSSASGVAVDVAAAVTGAATVGEVLVSRTVRDVVAGSGVVLADRGSLDVPVAPGDWHVFRVVAA